MGLTIDEIIEAPWEESPGTPSPPNTGTTKCAPIILPMGESGEAPRVERPGTPRPQTLATQNVFILVNRWVTGVRRLGREVGPR
jgi:hypothetical protein